MAKGVILAAGEGSRMRRAMAGLALSEAQEGAAAGGVKGLIPILGRPFLDHLLDRLATVGLRRVCIVVRPDDDEIEAWAKRRRPLDVEIAVQSRPRGTADAVLAAADFIDRDPCLVLNSDTLYPAADLTRLAACRGAALLGVERSTVLRQLDEGLTNVTAERLRGFALLELSGDGSLSRLREKADPQVWKRLEDPVLVSVNAWRLNDALLRACGEVEPSPRGELELPAAAQLAIDRFGETLRVVVGEEPILDLTDRGDVVAVERLLCRAGVGE